MRTVGSDDLNRSCEVRHRRFESRGNNESGSMNSAMLFRETIVTHLSLQVDPASKLRSEVRKEIGARSHFRLGYAFAYSSRLRLEATIST